VHAIRCVDFRRRRSISTQSDATFVKQTHWQRHCDNVRMSGVGVRCAEKISTTGYGRCGHELVSDQAKSDSARTTTGNSKLDRTHREPRHKGYMCTVQVGAHPNDSVSRKKKNRFRQQPKITNGYARRNSAKLTRSRNQKSFSTAVSAGNTNSAKK